MTESKSMTVAGKQFNLTGLVQSTTLETQLGNVFHILQCQHKEIEAQKVEMDAVKKKLAEIDDLHRKVGALQQQAEQILQRIAGIEAQADKDREEMVAIRGRVEVLELLSARVETCEKLVTEQQAITTELKTEFEQLRNDAKDALTLASTVSFFKTELMELQEDVTKVLHQAPHTERLMHQVQTNLEKSTEQLQSVVGKTAVMEGALGKIALTVDEFKVLRADLVARVHSLENPKVDRMGGVEEMTKNLEKQVKLLTQNWMNNWGSHEQSMTILRQDIMLHVDQLRNKCDNMVSGGHAATADGSGSLTFVRMDEEERSMLQKAIEQHGRDIARIDNKKADAQLVLGVLADKADSSQLDAKMDKAAFEARIANLEAALSLGLVAPAAASGSGSVADAASVDDTFASQLINDLAIAQAQAQAVGAAAQQQQQQQQMSHQRPSTGDPLLRPSTAPPESFASMPSPEPTRQLAPAHRLDPAAAALQSETQEHQRLLQQMGKRQGSMQKQGARGGHQRPQSTPPVLPGTVIPGAMSMEEGMEQPSRHQRGAPGGGAPSDVPGAAMSAQKRLMIARKDKTHPSLRKGPGLSITPSTAWAPNPGKIRPGTANTGASKPGGHAVYKFDSRGDGDARSMAPLPSLDVPGDDARVEGWPRNSATSTPQIRPGTAVSRGEGDA